MLCTKITMNSSQIESLAQKQILSAFCGARGVENLRTHSMTVIQMAACLTKKNEKYIPSHTIIHKHPPTPTPTHTNTY